MKDERVLAYCNLFGVLGAIPTLLELDPDAAELVKDQRISIGFSVKSGSAGDAVLLWRQGVDARGRAGLQHQALFPDL